MSPPPPPALPPQKEKKNNKTKRTRKCRTRIVVSQDNITSKSFRKALIRVSSLKFLEGNQRRVRLKYPLVGGLVLVVWGLLTLVLTSKAQIQATNLRAADNIKHPSHRKRTTTTINPKSTHQEHCGGLVGGTTWHPGFASKNGPFCVLALFFFPVLLTSLKVNIVRASQHQSFGGLFPDAGHVEGIFLNVALMDPVF